MKYYFQALVEHGKNAMGPVVLQQCEYLDQTALVDSCNITNNQGLKDAIEWIKTAKDTMQLSLLMCMIVLGFSTEVSCL